MTTTKKHVYYFGPKGADGDASMKSLLGGKGANLAEMCNLKVPVPSGFTITTESCISYFDGGGKAWPKGLEQEVSKNLKKLEKEMGKKFGDPGDPLLLSIRSGSRASMPGMMDTVLNLGLNDTTTNGLAEKSRNRRSAFDSYRRFLTMFGDVVMGMDRGLFDTALAELKNKNNATSDTDLTAESLAELVETYKAIIQETTGSPFPQDPAVQLRMAINAVFESWNNDRAKTYRQMYKIPASWGTAVNVQAMVFGNRGEGSGTGVAFTRNPSTGQRRLFGEYLFNAQGEDVVAGLRTPLSVSEMGKKMPECKAELDRIYKRLEKHYRDMLDIEFTVEEGKLWMLQCRVGKRTAAAAVRIAVEMVEERLINRSEALLRVQPDQLDQLLHDTIDPDVDIPVLTEGLPASPGAGVGRVVFTAADAVTQAEAGEPVILVRHETSPEDIKGMNAARGILTATGGMTSHAAVVARGMGRCCVAGAEAVHIPQSNDRFVVSKTVVKAGDWITLDGTRGQVFVGQAPLVKPKLSLYYQTLMTWADAARKLKIRANADSPHDAKLARKHGAEGVGLCRTEHMFFEGDRIVAVREMILADDLKERKAALAKLLSMQRADFTGMFKAMEGLPVTVRLLDPPLHEFLPKEAHDFEEVAADLGVKVDLLKERAESHHEFNPMLGHRGCRLGITYPEVYEMQTRAIVEAACGLKKKGVDVRPEIMVPLVSDVEELVRLRKRIEQVINEVTKAAGVSLKVAIGTMIELPRACLTAGQIAGAADFFSFGTNDLTQTTFGLSRDDSGRFLPHYVTTGLLPHDPFVAIDREGVGELMRIGVARGRATKPKLKIGICGEHGGDPSSIEFCHSAGLDYVSCSPYRVPVARLAAAHVALREKGTGVSLRKTQRKEVRRIGKVDEAATKKSDKAKKKAASRWSVAKKQHVKAAKKIADAENKKATAERAAKREAAEAKKRAAEEKKRANRPRPAGPSRGRPTSGSRGGTGTGPRRPTGGPSRPPSRSQKPSERPTGAPRGRPSAGLRKPSGGPRKPSGGSGRPPKKR